MAATSLTTEFEVIITAFLTVLNATFVDFSDWDACEQLRHSPMPQRCVVGTGHYALSRLIFPGEDVHLVCASPNSRVIFWALFQESFQLSDHVSLAQTKEDGVVELSSPALSLHSGERGASLRELARLRRVDKLDMRTYLHFCVVPPNYLILDFAAGRMDISRLNTAPSPALRLVIQAQRNATNESMILPAQRALFKSTVNSLYSWATTRGLVGSRYGFLSPNLLVQIMAEIFPIPKSDRFDERELRLMAFNEFKSESYLACLVQATGGSTANSRRISRSTLTCIERDLTPEARAAITSAVMLETFANDDELVEYPGNGYLEFLSDHPELLLVECETWAPSLDRRVTFQEVDAPRNVNKVVEAFRNPSQHRELKRFAIESLRIWPKPLAHCPEQKAQAIVIGIKHKLRLNEEERSETYRSELQDYIEEQILDYDRTIGLISFKCATRAELGTSNLSTAVSGVVQAIEKTPPTSPSITISGNRNKGRFRSAHSAISRLLHDPKYADEEFIVGYKDRFLEELAWIPLQFWVGKQTEDVDFVPEHRVRQIRRVEAVAHQPSTLLWDREERLDLTG